MRVHGWLLAALMILGPGLAGAGTIETVDVELIMLVDASGTIDDAEHALIRDEIAAGLRDASDSLPAGGVAFNLVYWANGQLTSALTPSSNPGSEPDTPLGWTVITTPGEADALATRIEGTVRDFDPDSLLTDPVGGLTSVASAISGATPMFGMNAFSSSNLVIDLVGDGSENFQIAASPIVELEIELAPGSFLTLPVDPGWGADLQAVADANAAGIVVNGLPIRPQAFDPPTNANEETELKDSQRVSRRLLAQFFSADGIDAEANPSAQFSSFTPEQQAAIIAGFEQFEAGLIADLGLQQSELSYHEWFYRDFATGGEGSFVEVAQSNGDIRRAVAAKLRREFGLPEPSAAWLIALGLGALLRRRA